MEKGHDPRDFVLVPFGGAGPMHGTDLASELGIRKVMVPQSCGVLSALGMVVGDERRDWVKTVYRGTSWDVDYLQDVFRELLAAYEDELKGMSLVRRADFRYRGQSHEITVDFFEDMDMDDLSEAFERAHEKAFGYRAENEPVELVNIRITALRSLTIPGIREDSSKKPGKNFLKRKAFFAGRWETTKVWSRNSLAFTTIEGPAVIEEEEATTVVDPGWKAELDNQGNLWLNQLT